MAFVNLSLLVGGAFVAIPVVLHLIMRQKPRPLVFPALRFIQQRRIANQRRLQLRHWMLLGLAMCGDWTGCARARAAERRVGGHVELDRGGPSGHRRRVVAGLIAVGGVSRAAVEVRRDRRWRWSAACCLVATLFIGRPCSWPAVRPCWAIKRRRSPRCSSSTLRRGCSIATTTRPASKRPRKRPSGSSGSFPADSEVAVADSRAGSGAFAVDRAAAADRPSSGCGPPARRGRWSKSLESSIAPRQAKDASPQGNLCLHRPDAVRLGIAGGERPGKAAGRQRGRACSM